MNDQEYAALDRWYWSTVYDQSFEVQEKRKEVYNSLESERIKRNQKENKNV